MKTRSLLLFALVVCNPPAMADQAVDTGTKLVLLGTAGGPAVKKSRAQPASAVVVNGDIYVLDAGDGVARQLALAGFSVTRVRAVFITHNHSDHMADYGTLLLRSWISGRRERIQTFGPAPLEQITRDYLDYMRWDIELRVREMNRQPLGDQIRAHNIERDGVIYEDENIKVTVFTVTHGNVKPAYGYRFDTADKSIVFSGDTSPNENVAEAAKGVDILVHEVLSVAAIEAMTSDNKVLKQHILDIHTNTDDVGEIATRAGVKMLVLSHFAGTGHPLYDRREVWEEAVRKHYSGPLIVGEDLTIID